MSGCIFCKIANKEIPKEFTYEDEDMMVFPDIHPVRPVHFLVVPKKHFVDFLDLSEAFLWKKLIDIAQKMIKEHNLSKAGYRLVVNGGGAQIIEHLHIHIMSPLAKATKM